MKRVILLLLFLSMEVYASDDAYCALIWRINNFKAESFKRVGNKTYDLTIVTDPNMTLVSKVTKNVSENYYTPLEGVASYWGLFTSQSVPFEVGNNFKIISINGRKDKYEMALSFVNNTWTNGCTVISPGQNLNWGGSTRIVLRVEFDKELSYGYYNFSNFKIPVRLFYEENKGFYGGNRALVAKYSQEAPFISVDSWSLQIKAPTCKYSDISIDFGKITSSQVRTGVSKTQNLSMYCENDPVSVKIYFADTKKTMTEKKCGSTSKEMNCKISMGDNKNQRFLEFGYNYFQPSGSGEIKIPINVVLKSESPTPGVFKDSAVLKVDIN